MKKKNSLLDCKAYFQLFSWLYFNFSISVLIIWTLFLDSVLEWEGNTDLSGEHPSQELAQASAKSTGNVRKGETIDVTLCLSTRELMLLD